MSIPISTGLLISLVKDGQAKLVKELISGEAAPAKVVAFVTSITGQRCAIRGTPYVGIIHGPNESRGIYGGDRYPVLVRIDVTNDGGLFNIFEFGLDQIDLDPLYKPRFPMIFQELLKRNSLSLIHFKAEEALTNPPEKGAYPTPAETTFALSEILKTNSLDVAHLICHEEIVRQSSLEAKQLHDFIQKRASPKVKADYEVFLASYSAAYKKTE